MTNTTLKKATMRKAIVLLFVLPLLLSGCATFKRPVSRSWPWSKAAQAKKTQTPSSMVVVWTDTVYNESGKPAVRGFGGRIYFYNDKNVPVPVSGQLAIFGFDDSQAEKVKPEADRKFVYTPEQMAERLADGPLGPSYHIWVPWEAVGGDPKRISLLPVLTTTDGQIVRGKPSLNVLPGRNLARERAQYAKNYLPPAASGVTQVTHQEAGRGGDGDGPAMNNVGPGSPQAGSQPPLRSTTIAVPRGMSDRISTMAAAVAEGDAPARVATSNQPIEARFSVGGPLPHQQPWPQAGQPEANMQRASMQGADPTQAGQPSQVPPNAVYHRMWHEEGQRQARFAQQRSRAQAWPGARSSRDPAPSPQSHARPQYHRPPSSLELGERSGPARY